MSPSTAPLQPDAADIARLLAGTHHNPHSILGAHEYPRSKSKGHTVIRAFKPGASAVAAVVGDAIHHMTDLGSGLFAVALPFLNLLDYRLDVEYGGTSLVIADAYRFLPTLGEVDLHLFNEGRHERLWEILGAHPRSFVTADGEVSGVSFAVWAPNARGVSVIGDFNGWNGNDAPMRTLGSSGVWELFWPGMTLGALYKFRVHGADGSVTDRADPFAFATELPPATASRVATSSYSWEDGEWMSQRASRNPVFEPMSTYEVHLASWRPGLNYRDLARELTEYVLAQGFTHVELLPVAEHPFGGSWGYQVTSYYAPTSRLGTPDDFRYLVDALHRAGIGVLVDWVPAHFPKDAWALARFDGTPLYEHADPHRAEQLDWEPMFSISDAPRYAISLSPMRCSGSTSSTSTGCASMPSHRCSISTIHGPRAAGLEHPRWPREPRGRPVPAGDERHGAQAASWDRHRGRGVHLLARRDSRN